MMMGMVSPQLRADEATCKKVLHDCDAALQAEQTENALQKQIIADQDKRYNDVSSELKSEEFWKPVAEGALVVVVLETLILALKK
jgi:hypothetical protein